MLTSSTVTEKNIRTYDKKKDIKGMPLKASVPSFRKQSTSISVAQIAVARTWKEREFDLFHIR